MSVDVINRSLKASREFCAVDYPVSDSGLPAVIDLEHVARLEDFTASCEILRDSLICYFVKTVVPAGVACHRLCRSAGNACGLKPCVENLILGPFEDLDVQGRVVAGTDAGILDRLEFAHDRIVVEDGVAVGLIG